MVWGTGQLWSWVLEKGDLWELLPLSTPSPKHFFFFNWYVLSKSSTFSTLPKWNFNFLFGLEKKLKYIEAIKAKGWTALFKTSCFKGHLQHCKISAHENGHSAHAESQNWKESLFVGLISHYVTISYWEILVGMQATRGWLYSKVVVCSVYPPALGVVGGVSTLEVWLLRMTRLGEGKGTAPRRFRHLPGNLITPSLFIWCDSSCCWPVFFTLITWTSHANPHCAGPEIRSMLRNSRCANLIYLWPYHDQHFIGKQIPWCQVWGHVKQTELVFVG